LELIARRRGVLFFCGLNRQMEERLYWINMKLWTYEIICCRKPLDPSQESCEYFPNPYGVPYLWGGTSTKGVDVGIHKNNIFF